MRHNLKLDAVPLGLAPGPSDNLIHDIDGTSASGIGHLSCKGGQPPDEILKALNSRIYPLALVDELRGPILTT